jgi:hypothetical protein
MSRNPRIENEHFKKEMDHFISPNSLFTSVDRERVLERIERAKKRKRWWGKPGLVLSVLLLFLVSGTLFGVLKSTSEGESMTADYVMSQLFIGMSKDEVQAVLGDGYEEVEQGMDSGPVYIMHRYDYPLEKGYVYQSTEDGFDIDGIRSDKMDMQVIVRYDGDLMAGYSLIYKEGSGKTVIRQVSEGDTQVIPVD